MNTPTHDNTLTFKWVVLLRRIGYFICGSALLYLLLTQVVFRYLIWPQLASQQATIAQYMGNKLGVDIELEQIQTGWKNWRPSLEIRQLRFKKSPSEQFTLEQDLLLVPHLSAIFRWDTLWSGAPRFYELSTHGIKIHTHRNPQGDWSVAGIPINQSSDSSTLPWFMSENLLQAQNIQIHVLDEFESTTNLDFFIRDLFIANTDLHHQIRLIADSGQSQNAIQLNGQFTHQFSSKQSNWRNWIGRFDWQLDQVSVRRLLYLAKNPNHRGDGFINGFGSIDIGEGGLINGQATLHAKNLRIDWDKKSNPLELSLLNTELLIQSQGKQETITAKQFDWQFFGQTNLPPNSLKDLQVTLGLQKDTHEIEQIIASAPHIPLSQISRIAQSLPLNFAWLKTFQKFEPSGAIDNLQVRWEKQKTQFSQFNPISKPQAHYEVSAKVSNIGWQEASKSFPGVQGITGDLLANDTTGSLDLNSSNVKLQAGQFISEKNLTLNSILGKISWLKKNDVWEIQSEKLTANNANIDLQTNFQLTTATKSIPPKLNLDLQIKEADAISFVSYLPKVIPANTLDYLSKSINSGTLKNGKLTIQGDPNYLPFSKKHPGTFELDANLSNITFTPVPLSNKVNGEWLPFTQVNALVSIRNDALKVTVPNGLFKSILAKDFIATMNLSQSPSVLNVSGTAQGKLNDMANYLAISPVATGFKDELQTFTFGGDASLQVDITESFASKTPTKVVADLNLTNNLITWKEIPSGFVNKGRLIIDETSYRTIDLQGNWLGGPINIKNNLSTKGVLDIFGEIESSRLIELLPKDGLLTPDSLRKKWQGPVNYQGSINKNVNRTLVNFNVDLKQLSVDLPDPIYKKSGNLSLGFIQVNIPSSSSSPNLTTTSTGIDWQIKLGDLIHSIGTYKDRRVEKHGLTIGNLTPVLPSKGLSIQFDTPSINLDAWSELIKTTQKSSEITAVATDEATGKIEGQVKTLLLANHKFENIGLKAERINGQWLANLISPSVEGTVRFQDKNADAPTGAIEANFIKLQIPNPEMPVVKSGAQVTAIGNNSTASPLPSLDLKIDQLIIGNTKLGELKLKALGKPQNWNIESFTIKNRFANLNGSGQWQKTSIGSGQTSLQVEITTPDGGALLKELGYAKVMSNGEGSLKGNLLWQGPPQDFNKKTLSGNLNFEMKKGEILQVDPGVAKLLGILSFQSLFKFATLNLKGSIGELVTPGTPFDLISAKGQLKNGLLLTDDFELLSTLARIAMRGQINLLEETQDLRITLYPRLNMASTSVAAYFLMTPVIGFSVLVGQYLFTSGLNRALEADYLIQGNWTDPEVIPLDQKGQPIDPEIIKTIRSKALINSPEKK